MRVIEAQPNPLTPIIQMMMIVMMLKVTMMIVTTMIVMTLRAGIVSLAPLITDDQSNEPITVQTIVHGREAHRLIGKVPKAPTVSMQRN